MKKYLLTLTLILPLLMSCNGFKREVCNAASDADKSPQPEISADNYLCGIDEYVGYIKANGEQLKFIHSQEQEHRTVISLLNQDTVRISVIGDSDKEDIDIYYRNSEPLLLSRERILDVDSNFLETVYLKDSKIYKCFRDGVELKNKDSLKMYAAMIDNFGR